MSLFLLLVLYLSNSYRILAFARLNYSEHLSNNSDKHENDTNVAQALKIAVFVRIALKMQRSEKQLQPLIPCIKSIVEAKDYHNSTSATIDRVDIHLVSIRQRSQLKESDVRYQSKDSNFKRIMMKNFESFASKIDNVYFLRQTENDDIPYFEMVRMSAAQANIKYDISINLHSKLPQPGLNHVLNCLCGTPLQVTSIFNHFYKNINLSAVASAGLLLPFGANMSTIASEIKDSFSSFNEDQIALIKMIHSIDLISHPRVFSIVKSSGAIVAAGNMFWERFSALYPELHSESYLKDLFSFLSKLNSTKSKDAFYDMYRLTLARTSGLRVSEILPAPKPIGIYFPQYHQFPENDRFWGEGFTEWVLLRNISYSNVKYPLSEEKGGLGYYNLTQKSIRAKQAELAKKYGLHGFMFYHYWFSGEKAPVDHKVMYKIPELMLLDGEPDLPFFFSWANEPWNRRWTGVQDDGEMLLTQSYGNVSDWTEHFGYLVQFFRHKNYIKIDGKPAFAIYRVGHVEGSLVPMLELWDKLAKESGFAGMYVIGTLGGHDYKVLGSLLNSASHVIPGCFHFFPGLTAYHRDCLTSKRSVESLSIPTKTQQFWGAMSGFDPRPRGRDYYISNPTPEQFRFHLMSSFASMQTRLQDFSRGVPNYYFITAWNEWNEQAVLEPSDKFGVGMLEALRDNLASFPITDLVASSSSSRVSSTAGDSRKVESKEKSFKVGVFIYIGSRRIDSLQNDPRLDSLSELIPCVERVVGAKRYFAEAVNSTSTKASLSIDLYIRYLSTKQDDRLLSRLKELLAPFSNEIDNLYTSVHTANVGLDVLPFLLQLNETVQTGRHYDTVLKLHSKSDRIWLKHTLQCLCGTSLHVASILGEFYRNTRLGLIGPAGYVFGPRTDPSTLSPHLIKKYPNLVADTPIVTFLPGIVSKMNEILSLGFDHDICPSKFIEKNLMIVAGTMFWARYVDLEPEEIVRVIPKLTFSRGYVSHNMTEHAFERFFPSLMKFNGREVRTISPAPKPIGIYFPQFHQFPENDRFWGEGFTEWTLLRKATDPHIKYPLSEEKGGLGYYNLTQKSIRAKQAELAKKYGLHGFMFYHYWFSGEKAPVDHKVMYKIPELMLLDGEPDLPFFFSWANEPWNRRWTGVSDAEGEVLLTQSYGNVSDWTEHFGYLVQFFRHKNYIKIDGKPAFAIYRVGHVGGSLVPMLELWDKLAKESGFAGMYVINTLGGFYRTENTSSLVAAAGDLVSASLHFWPGMNYNGIGLASRKNLNSFPVKDKPQFWGAMTGFDAMPRRNVSMNQRIFQNSHHFRSELLGSFSHMSAANFSSGVDNYYFLTAWNEWNEQAILEPTNKSGFQMLQALKESLLLFPSQAVVDSNFEVHISRHKRIPTATKNETTKVIKKKKRRAKSEKASNISYSNNHI